MGLLYIIISLLLNDEVHSVFEVMKSPNPFSWERAVLHCNTNQRNWNIAVPAVDLRTMRVIDAIALEGEAWVGYFLSYEYFLFIECVPLSVINSVVYAQYSTGRTNNRPGMCYSLCGLQGYIGLQNGSCYCIDARNFSTTNTIPFNRSCMDPLHCGNGMLCGYQGHSKISIYKNVSLSSSYIKGDGSGCLLVSKDNEYEMSVVTCTSNYRHLCEAQIGQILYLERSEEKYQWVHSITNCGKTFKRPTTFLGDITSYIFPNVSGSWWATVVRDLVIRNCSECCTKIGTPLYEGYLTNSNDGIKLEFVHGAIRSTKKSVACISGEKMANSTSEKMDTAPEITSSAPSKTISTPTTSKATITSFVSESTVDLSLFLAVVVSSTSLLVISVLLNIYFIRKRGRMPIGNTTEVRYVIPVAHEDERGRYDIISTTLSTETRSIPERHCNISTFTATHTSPDQDQDGYITPIIAGENATYDYFE